jgi:branched-chain amino acid transport system permease protein
MGATACGVDTVRAKIEVFVVSAALAGLAGALMAHYIGSLSPASFTLHRSVVFLTMVALGGSGSLFGSVAATVLLTLLPYVDSIVPGVSRQVAGFLQDWEPDIYALVLISVMLFLPRGLAGVGRTVAARAREWVARPAAGGEGSAT